MRTFNCESCGIESTTRRSNTKRCPVCRALRDLIFVDGGHTKPQKCTACDAEFLPTKSREQYCGACAEFTFTNSATPVGTCAFCEQERKLPIEDAAICHPCLHDPEKRQPIIRALTRKVQRRVSAQATT